PGPERPHLRREQAVYISRKPPTPEAMFPVSTTRPESHDKSVRRWLVLVAALVFAMVIVGGATRLTESGLSIVEWRPITGTIPPLSATDWQAEFEKYQAIPQYHIVNRGMSLDEFKAI